MKKTLIIFIFLTTLLLPSALAFSTFNEEIQIQNDLTTIFVIEATTDATDQIELTLPLQSSIDIIQIDGVDSTCDIQDSSDTTIISCNASMIPHTFFLKGQSIYPIILSEENYFFTLNQYIDAESINLKITLPENSVISEERVINPEPSNQFHLGESQVLLWRFEEPTSFAISFLASNPREGLFWKMTIPTLLLIIALSVWLIKFKKKSSLLNPKESLTSNLDHLLENEKKVICALNAAKKDNKDFLWQKELQLKTGLTKVQLSRTLRRMLERKLIIKEPHGASNKISINSREE